MLDFINKILDKLHIPYYIEVHKVFNLDDDMWIDELIDEDIII